MSRNSKHMEIKVLYFASAREARGKREERVTLAEGATTETLIAALLELCPALTAVMRTAVLALNEQYLESSSDGDGGLAAAALKSGDEVAVIPPISGG